MPLWKQYLRPTTLAEALQALSAPPGPALAIAGGSDLMLDLQQGRHAPVHTLVDLTEVAELTALEIRGAELFIGAAVPVSHIASAPLAQQHAQALVEACNLIAGPQVRNVATLGGNVAHALPAADGTISLLALGAQAEVADISARRRLPFGELFLGPGKSALKPGLELIVGFSLPLQKTGQASAFRRIMRAQGIALPILNLSAWLERRDERITDLRIAAGPSGQTPWRATGAESALRGQSLTAETLALALEALLKQAAFRTSPRRASADYRRQLVSVLLHDALTAAWERAAK